MPHLHAGRALLAVAVLAAAAGVAAAAGHEGRVSEALVSRGQLLLPSLVDSAIEWLGDRAVRLALYVMVCVAGLDAGALPVRHEAVAQFSCASPRLGAGVRRLVASVRPPTDREASRLAMERGEGEELEQQQERVALLEEGEGSPLFKAVRWPGRTIPLVVPVPRTRDEAVAVVTTLTAAARLTARTNLRVVPVPANHPAHKLVLDPSRKICQSGVGMHHSARNRAAAWTVEALRESRQPIQIGGTCSVGGAMHELLHAAGFAHTHMRSDRDAYVRVHRENIGRRYRLAFSVADAAYTDQLRYDYLSIMHYRDNFFVKPGLPRGTKTLVPRAEDDPESWKSRGLPPPLGDPGQMGRAEDLSDEDVRMVNLAYPKERAAGAKALDVRNDPRAADASSCVHADKSAAQCALVNACPYAVEVTAAYRAADGAAGTAARTVHAHEALLLHAAASCEHVDARWTRGGGGKGGHLAFGPASAPAPRGGVQLEVSFALGQGSAGAFDKDAASLARVLHRLDQDAGLRWRALVLHHSSVVSKAVSKTIRRLALRHGKPAGEPGSLAAHGTPERVVAGVFTDAADGGKPRVVMQLVAAA